jgi:hypothetical protein
MKQDWADHQTGHELLVTIRDEKDTPFVLLWFKDMLNNPRQIEVNDAARRELDTQIFKAHPGVTFTEVDMSNSNLNAYTYERLATRQLGINLQELEYGPIAIVIKNGVGHQVVFKGNYDEFMETTDRLISEINQENEKDLDKTKTVREAQALAKKKDLQKSNGKFEYFRPSQYNERDFQSENIYGYKKDPFYNENPVPLP